MYFVQIALISLLLMIVGCNAPDKPYPINKAEEDLLTIQDAFAKNDTIKLKSVLDRWAIESVPISKQEFERERLIPKLLYRYFEDHYKPETYNVVESLWKFYPDYSTKEYIILQTTMWELKRIAGMSMFALKDEESIGEQHYKDCMDFFPNKTPDTLINFRPNLKIPGKKIIYLTDEREKILKNFFEYEKYKSLSRGDQNYDSLIILDEKRYNFINKYFGLTRNHWKHVWWFHTFPMMEYALLTHNGSMLQIVNRKTYASTTSSLYQLQNQHWKFVHDCGLEVE